MKFSHKVFMSLRNKTMFQWIFLVQLQLQAHFSASVLPFCNLGVQVDDTIVEILFLMYCFLTIKIPSRLRKENKEIHFICPFLPFLCPLNAIQSIYFIIILINNTETYLTTVKYSNEKKNSIILKLSFDLICLYRNLWL